MVERCCAHARSLVMDIGQLRGAEVLCEPTLNQGMVRFVDLNQERLNPILRGGLTRLSQQSLPIEKLCSPPATGTGNV